MLPKAPPTRSILARLRRPLNQLLTWAEETSSGRRNGKRSPAHRFVAKMIEVVILVARWDVIQRLQLHAQALTYDTLLALVPLIAVVFAVVSGFGGIDELRGQLEGFLISMLSAQPGSQVALRIREIVGNIQLGGTSTISTLILIFSVMSLLGRIESSFNIIFGTTAQRPWVTRMLTYWAALTLGPLLLLASLGLTAALQTSEVGEFVTEHGFGALLIYLLPISLTWLGFTALYMVVPAARVRLSSAFFAAVVAGSLWSAAKWGYAIYAKNAFTMQNIYGSLAAVPLFIFWLYLSWTLVLLGAQLTFAFQNASNYAKEQLGQNASIAFRERLTCRILLEIAAEFLSGRPPPQAEGLANSLGVPRRLLEQIVTDLKGGHFITEAENTAGLLPARELDQIDIADVLSYLREGKGTSLDLPNDASQTVLDDLLAAVDRARDEAGEKATLRSLAGQLPERPSGPNTETAAPPVH